MAKTGRITLEYCPVSLAQAKTFRFGEIPLGFHQASSFCA